ncbi:MAG: glycosyltransferase family 4 protein [Verrucomicrobiia bacterium]|jgi:phosphatidylinositol alpha-1,6-mannosyltransferase
MTQATETESRIVIVTHEFAPFHGGVATYSEELAAALHRAGRAVEVWAPDYAGRGASGGFTFPVVRLRAGGTLRFGHLLQLARQLMARRAQLEQATVLLTSVGAHLAFMILVPLGCVKCRRLFSVLHGSEVLRFQGSVLWRLCARWFFPRVERVLTVSEFSKSLIERSFLSPFLARAIVVVPGACSAAARQPPTTASPGDGRIRILTLARVHPRKGQLDTARALASLPPDLRAGIVYQVGGTGDAHYLRRVEAACRDAGVAFDYLGEISPGSLAATYQQCDVYAMTSRSLPRSVEGFGITYLEAGFHGKPVIGYRSGGAAEAVVDGETGLLVEEGNVAALTGAFQRLVTDAALRRRLGEGGRNHAARFSWEAAARTVSMSLDGAS